MSDETFDKLKAFVIEEAAVDAEEVTKEAKIEEDLGIYGDDAVEFMIAYGKVFNVDVSKFMAGEYFDAEGDWILPAIIRFLTGRKKKKNKILTVAHLEKGIYAGRLDEEVINS
jgi:acyl carrier protein